MTQQPKKENKENVNIYPKRVALPGPKRRKR
jgi:hypothetical protein